MQFVKPAIYAAMLMLVMAALTALYKAIETSGYDRARVEILQEQSKIRAKQEKDFNEKLGVAVHESEYWRKVAIANQNKPAIIVTKYKDKIIRENPDCTKLHGFSELLNESRKRFNI